MVLRMTWSGYKGRGCPGSIPGWVLKKKKSPHLIYAFYFLHVIYIVYILYAYYLFYKLHLYVESKVSGIYKLDFSYNIYCGTHVTDGVTENIVWIQGTRMPWFNTRLGLEKRKKAYILYMYYISYMPITYLIYSIYM